jgi:Tol biopolymer transport system component
MRIKSLSGYNSLRSEKRVISISYIIKVLFLVLYVFILVNCSALDKKLIETPPSNTSTPTPTIKLSPTTSVTTEITATAPVQVPSLAPTKSVKDQGALREMNCYKPLFDNTLSIRTNGVIVFSGEFYRSPSYLLNMKSAEKIILDQGTNEKLLGFSVSTNGKWLAYQKINNKKDTSEILVTGSDGKVVKTINWEPSWRKIAGWLDDQRLLISKNRGNYKIDSIIMLNPFTHQQLEIPPDYPNMWDVWVENNFNWGSFNKSGTIYNRAITRVIYPISGEQKSGIVLWNLKEQKEVISLYDGFGYQPKWRPNEDGFIINLSGDASWNEEFFYIDETGEINQVTNLNKSGESATIGFFNWSPDGNSIAFWLNLDQVGDYPDIYPNSPAGYPNRLAILDLINKKVVDTCVPGDLSLSFPIWSPDGKYIVIDDYYGPDFPFKGRVFLTDTIKGIAIKIAENVTPIGWMQP